MLLERMSLDFFLLVSLKASSYFTKSVLQISKTKRFKVLQLLNKNEKYVLIENYFSTEKD